MDPADHQEINRCAEQHCEAHRQYHADEIIYHADHVDDHLDDNEQYGQQHRCDYILDRPFICLFHFEGPPFSRYKSRNCIPYLLRRWSGPCPIEHRGCSHTLHHHFRRKWVPAPAHCIGETHRHTGRSGSPIRLHTHHSVSTQIPTSAKLCSWNRAHDTEN